jgi:hypothetical protein
VARFSLAGLHRAPAAQNEPSFDFLNSLNIRHRTIENLRAKYPKYRYMQSESERGWGAFDWKAAEHTFGLMTHYLGNGCDEYTFWNAVLADGGVSSWGWKQNALIRVDSKIRAATYPPTIMLPGTSATSLGRALPSWPSAKETPASCWCWWPPPHRANTWWWRAILAPRPEAWP